MPWIFPKFAGENDDYRLTPVTIFQPQTETDVEGKEDKLGKSELKAFGTKATQSGLYKCVFRYKVEQKTYPVYSNEAFVVIQG